mmetsp:Transcript_15168/g.17572  ORF Transcript_15168/g.17572 Transcript_15168/m.17572 type:complete len:712 (+) Transcript_15168:387-2522(+)
MGNCLGTEKKKKGPVKKTGTATASANKIKKPISTAANATTNGAASGAGAAARNKNKRSSTIHEVMMKEHKLDVYKKYTEFEVLGNGSMGHVAKVKVNAQWDGGSTYVGSTTGGATGGSKTARDAKMIEKAFLKAGTATSSGNTHYNTGLSSLDEERVSGSGASGDNTVNSSLFQENLEDSETSTITKKSNSEYALKSIHLDKVSVSFIEELRNEINILKGMDHPNIVKLHEVFSHKKQIYLILELCDGGDLYTRLPYTEQDSAYITGKLLNAIKYMHDHGIVHRDLKFENIMFENKSEGAEIKVIDFGLSKKFASNKLGVMREGVGTLYSMAPQVLQGVYNSQADMWSVGVITYMLISSHRPFYNKKRKIMIDRIMRCDYSYNKGYWDPISGEAKDFIDHLLVLDSRNRYNAQQALNHPWFKKQFKGCCQDRAPSESTKTRVTDNLIVYKNNKELKKLALNVIAHRSSTSEILNLRKAFDHFDTGNDGVISSQEFKVGLQQKCNYSDAEIKEMFTAIDINQTGDIMYTEFIAATLEAQGQVDEERIAEAFDRLDSDNTGSISKENIMEFLGETDTTMEDIEIMIAAADIDDCGEVSFDEFLAMFRPEEAEESEDEEEKDEEKRKSQDSTNRVSVSLLTSLKHFSADTFGEDLRGSGSRASGASGSRASGGSGMGSLASDDLEDIDEDEKNLVGIDAVIPGGKYDSLRDEEV